MQINTYLSFDGECKAAMTFYAEALGGKIDMIFTYGESPMAEQTPPALRDRVMHSQLIVGDAILMGADSPPEMLKQPQGFTININVDTTAEAERIFNALAQGATVTMPLGETFWALRCGALTDRFGTPWMINCLRPCNE